MKKLTFVMDDDGYAILYRGDDLVEGDEAYSLALSAMKLAGVEIISIDDIRLDSEQMEEAMWLDGDVRHKSLKPLKEALNADPEVIARNQRIAELEAELKKLREN